MKKLALLIIIILIYSCSNPIENDINACGVMPYGNKISKFRIIQVLPNPIGPEDNGENFVIKNFDTNAQEIFGWKIINADGHIWSLNPLGQFAPCEQKTLITIEDNVLKNNGDTIRMFDFEGNLIQTVSWGVVEEGEVVYVK